MRNKLSVKKILSLVGLLVITIGIILTTFLIQGKSILQIKAGPTQDPKNVQITNISDNSFTISYTTDDQFIGTISYGSSPSNLGNLVLDDRDQLSQTTNKYFVHSITLHNLAPETNYYFSITSGDKTYLNNNQPYNIKTGIQISNEPLSQAPIAGSVITSDGSTPSQALVYITLNGAQKISALTKIDGTYTLPLNNLRNSALNDYYSLIDSSIIAIQITTGALISNISISANDINPVPTITLSNSYDFSVPQNTTPTIQAPTGSFPDVGHVISTGPKILTPKTDQEFSDQQPQFDGTGQPNETVNIEIHSDEKISTQVTTNSNGSWNYRPNKPLSPGDHTITITTKNSQGILEKITQHFTVFAAGSEVNQSATPSGTISPTQIATPFITQTLTPTPDLSPTPTSTVSQGISPAPTLPPTGSSSVIIAAIAGFSALMAGMGFFLLNKRSTL